MSIEDTLLEDYKKAMKENNQIEKVTVQYLRAMILKERKEKQRDLSDDEVEKVILSERKKRSEALGLYEKANRQDKIEETYKELACISRYLPKPLDESELKEIIQQVIDEVGNDKKKFGQIMTATKMKVGSRADGGTISKLLKEMLVD